MEFYGSEFFQHLFWYYTKFYLCNSLKTSLKKKNVNKLIFHLSPQDQTHPINTRKYAIFLMPRPQSYKVLSFPSFEFTSHTIFTPHAFLLYWLAESPSPKNTCFTFLIWHSSPTLLQLTSGVGSLCGETSQALRIV